MHPLPPNSLCSAFVIGLLLLCLSACRSNTAPTPPADGTNTTVTALDARYRPFWFDNGPDYPSEGLYRIVDAEQHIGYADAETHRVVIEPRYSCAYPFEGGKAKVSSQCQHKKDGEHILWHSDNWHYIDPKGDTVP